MGAEILKNVGVRGVRLEAWRDLPEAEIVFQHREEDGACVVASTWEGPAHGAVKVTDQMREVLPTVWRETQAKWGLREVGREEALALSWFVRGSEHGN